jgi:uncharacterized protein with ParB-like and HNH nuclease domain
MLSNLSAKPLCILQLLSNNLFFIPNYQRPYTWDINECESLWNDLVANYESEEGEYFLGSIVLAPTKHGKNCFEVIDGQQRLITLSIMLRVLYDRDGDNDDFLKTLFQIDSRDKEKSGKALRIVTEVLGKTESNYLQTVLARTCEDKTSSDDNAYKKSHHSLNADYFREATKGFTDEKGNDTLRQFIDHIFNNVYILPIETDDRENALIIFDTINNRGLELSDGDIFKSQLYHAAEKKSKEKEFITRWDNLTHALEAIDQKNVSITSLFRFYMHLLRGEHGEATKVIGLREFFEGKTRGNNKKKQSKNEFKLTHRTWEQTMDSLERLKAAWDYLRSKDSGAINKWYEVLLAFNNEWAVYPVYIRVYHSIKQDEQGKWKLIQTHEERCVRFMRSLARFVFAKGHYSKAGKNSLEDAMSAAVAAASRDEEYLPEIFIDDVFVQFLDDKLNRSPKIRRGFCMILELENDNSGDWKGFSGEVEHILPQRWDSNFYDKWDAEKAEDVKHKIGNLVFLEKQANIKGSNDFFNQKRKIAYGSSQFAQVKDLCDSKNYPDWTFEIYIKRHEESKNKLLKFFTGD